MTRTEIEITLNRDRAWLIETVAAMPESDVMKPATKSENDASRTWSAKDHLAHLIGIEGAFNAMIRRHLDGDPNPVALRTVDQGKQRTIEQIMASVHRMNEEYVDEHRAKPLTEIIAIGQRQRAETLDLLGAITDDQLREKLPGAPWADGTIGGVIAANAAHGRQHWKWVKDGWVTAPATND